MLESGRNRGGVGLAAELVKELIDAGVHFGHRVSRWNPKMEPYIFGKRNLIHIINVKETLKGILLAKKFLARIVGQGKDVLVVGTKRQARKSIDKFGESDVVHIVTDRWLGGTLTNFREIRKRVKRLEELEGMEADGQLDAYSKKEGASLRREMRKITRNVGGIRNMKKLPGVMVVVDEKREIIAVREARKLGIPLICLLDTDGDPDLVDIPIPCNDDAMRAVEIILRELGQGIELGYRGRGGEQESEAGEGPKFKRRSQRMSTSRAYEETGASEDTGESSGESKPAEGETTPETAKAQTPDHTTLAEGKPDDEPKSPEPELHERAGAGEEKSE